MKKLIAVIAVMASLLAFGAISASAEHMTLEYDGGTHEYYGEVYALVVNNQLLDPPLSPIIFNDSALVPVREIFEEVGAEVNYISETQTVEINGAQTHVTMQINDNVAYVNGKKKSIPNNIVPKLISKVGGETKTMVPVRFIGESIGLDVDFDADDGAILIESDGYELEEFAEPEYIPEPELRITDLSYDIIDERNTDVSITASGAIGTYSDFVLKSPERIVLDVLGARLANVPENTEVFRSGISTIRMGDNGERARLVIDTNKLKKYTVSAPDSNKLVIHMEVNAQDDDDEVYEETYDDDYDDGAYEEEYDDDDGGSEYSPSGEKLIVLDAGHGGSDSGAVGYMDGDPVREKDLTLEITYRVKDILENAGYLVSMTRTGDTLPSLSERPAQANAENAALFVSIHINSADNASAHGTEVFYASSNNDDGYCTTSRNLAQNILDRMLYYMHSTNRGVKTAEHAVTRRCNMPAALAEVGFISNDDEVRLMTDAEYQQKAAQGIAEGIIITLRDVVMPE